MQTVIQDAPVAYRNQNRRYPWWVKSVAAPTVEVDREQTGPWSMKKTAALFARHLYREDYETFIKEFPDFGLKYYLGEQRMIKAWRQRWDRVKKNVQNQTPGEAQKDLALVNAAYSLYYHTYIDFEELTSRSAFVNVTQRTGSEPWRGSPEEASRMIEKAAITLGASQVGFTTIDPLYLGRRPDTTPGMKYVIVLLTEWSPEGIRRADTGLGLMANRVQTFREQMAFFGLRNFIKGLGYRQSELVGPWPAYGVLAGLGELGRMNRLVSPIFGAAINIIPIVTDLPLAVDKPVDFGLQTFCKGCKRCAEACPVRALSFDDEPTWEVQGEWNRPGKRVYYEKSVLCAEYQFINHSSCSLCLAVCPWTKQDVTYLHKISKVISAKLPFLAKFMVKMDKLFGYGPTKDPQKLKDWWAIKEAPFGLNTRRR